MPGWLILICAIVAILFIISLLSPRISIEEPKPSVDLKEYTYNNMNNLEYDIAPGPGVIKTTVTGSKIINHDDIDNYQTGIVETKRIHPVHRTIEVIKINHAIKLKCGHTVNDTTTASLSECHECKALVCQSCIKQCFGCSKFFCPDHYTHIGSYTNGRINNFYFCTSCLEVIRDQLGDDKLNMLAAGTALIEDPRTLLPEIHNEPAS